MKGIYLNRVLKKRPETVWSEYNMHRDAEINRLYFELVPNKDILAKSRRAISHIGEENVDYDTEIWMGCYSNNWHDHPTSGDILSLYQFSDTDIAKRPVLFRTEFFDSGQYSDKTSFILLRKI